jgi:2-polyprenyl-3-methyl-5-hydroxy-6-metoxy-1,4-benzoquinol methylase
MNVSNFLSRVFFKLLIGPLKYGKKGDYDARQYWKDRFAKYGESILGPGNEALTADENIRMYETAKSTFIETCTKEKIDFRKASICEIGLGAGFYTEILANQKVQHYCGFDIADVIIPKLAEKFPDFKFEQKDISSEALPHQYDLIILIDVIQHIVNKDKFQYALKNIAEHLTENGLLLIGPLARKKGKVRFYVHSWTINEVAGFFPENAFTISAPIEFRNGHLYAIRKK